MSGIGNNSLLGSSTGFKKRNLLRPASGVLSKKAEYLRCIDASQSEPMIATFLRGEVAAIEEEINLLDKDRRLRQGESGLQKGYVTALRKWLQANQSLSEKEDEDIKILKYLGVDNYESGFRKLWKLLCHLDLSISKISELQVIHFLLYDEMFNDLGKDSHRNVNILAQITNNNYISSTFQITQILLDRAKDVYAATKRGTSAGKEERRGKDETGQLIQQLRRENQKLNAMLEQLSFERENQKKKLAENTQKNITQSQKSIAESHGPADKASVQRHLEDIEKRYEEHIKFLNSQKTSAQCEANELKVKIGALQAQLKTAGQISNPINFPKAASGSYEQTLMEQMEKMRRGFEKKIAVLKQEFASRERQLRRRQVDFKAENEKIKWQKSLLLKKFDLLTK